MGGIAQRIPRGAALLVVAAAAAAAPARARDRARADPRGLRREERRLRADARLERHVRLPARGPVGVHAAALRVVPRGALLAARPLVGGRRARAGRWWRSSRRCSCSRSAPTSRPCGPACSPRSSRRCTRTSSGTTSTSTARSSTGCSRRRSSCSRCSRTSAARCRCALGLGAVTGLAILSNARLLLLPLVLAPYVAWRVRPGRPRDRRSGARRRRRRPGDRPVGRPEQGRDRVRDDHDGHARALEGEQPGDLRRPGARRLDRRRARPAGRAALAGEGRRDLGRGGEGGGRVRAVRRSTATRSSTSGATSPARRRGSRCRPSGCSGRRSSA